MKVASLDLCKELYELSGWNDTSFNYINSALEYGVDTAFKDYSIDKHYVGFSPAYDLGYLLRKLVEVGAGVRYVLPEPYDSIDKVMKEWHGKFIASTPDSKFKDYPYADTPENALCKLAIELLEQEILTRKSS